ncbi:uncharacterized protein LOC122056954 isoform X2 [Macadamia integrifolia]|uniref:uncharacterized protein LOC122056954 isoform X2 n=1 Tax=Macadamia integrifolia TaxID=60698 RepID=UPI001C52BE4C|nr:uncharacterized protein LOC122056954 isoform X2 [Macadamia integrifolia]
MAPLLISDSVISILSPTPKFTLRSDYLEPQEKDCDICGVEITDGAVSVNQHPFRKKVLLSCLAMRGLAFSKECKICDFFVYIHQRHCSSFHSPSLFWRENLEFHLCWCRDNLTAGLDYCKIISGRLP